MRAEGHDHLRRRGVGQRVRRGALLLGGLLRLRQRARLRRRVARLGLGEPHLRVPRLHARRLGRRALGRALHSDGVSLRLQRHLRSGSERRRAWWVGCWHTHARTQSRAHAISHARSLARTHARTQRRSHARTPSRAHEGRHAISRARTHARTHATSLACVSAASHLLCLRRSFLGHQLPRHRLTLVGQLVGRRLGAALQPRELRRRRRVAARLQRRRWEEVNPL